jgi:transposase
VILSGAMECPSVSNCPHVKKVETLLTHIEKERAEQAEVMAAMKAELDALKRMVYGRSSEKMPPVAKELRGRGKIKKRDSDKAAARRNENQEKRKDLETTEVHHSVEKDGPSCPACDKARDEFRPVGEGRRTTIYEFIPVGLILSSGPT